MVDETTLNRIVSYVLIGALFVLAFLILRPILVSVITGFLAGYIFYPLYKRLYKATKRKNLSAFLICLLGVLIIIIPLIIFVPLIIRQVFEIYLSLQQINISDFLLENFPSVFSTELANQFSSSLNSFIGNLVNSLLNTFARTLVNLPIIMLHIILILFTFYFVLRDMENLKQYVKSLMPFSAKTGNEFFLRSKEITNSVIYGQILIGILQGITTGIGLFLFRAPTALTLTFIATIVGIIPIIGPSLVWFPAAIYMLISGRAFAGVGLLIYGVIVVSWVDALIRPNLVAWKTKVNSALVLIGMVGGFLVFGFLGFFIGPLVISYLLLILEMYRKKNFDFIFKEEKEE